MTIPTHIREHLSLDNYLVPLVQLFGAELHKFQSHTRIYEELLNSIIGQQLSGKAANAIRKNPGLFW